MTMRNVKLVAFDCDGVLFDTAEANRMYYSDILRHCGLPALTEEQFRFVHMHTVHESMAYLFPDENLLQAALAFRKTMNYRKYLKYHRLEPQLVPLLEKLRPQIKTAIATNRTDTMEKLLDEISFDAPDLDYNEIKIDAKYVKEKLDNIIKDEDLSKYIL